MPVRLARWANVRPGVPLPPTLEEVPPALYEPRPDLAADTRAWQALLETAFLLDGEEPRGLLGALHGVRCCGARLVPLSRHQRDGRGYRLAPGDDYHGGTEAWAGDRERWLLPHADVLTPLLKGLRIPGARSGIPHPNDGERNRNERT